MGSCFPPMQCRRRVSSLLATVVVGWFVMTGTSVHAGDLHTAAQRGDVAAIDALLANHASIDERDMIGTPLHYAVMGGQVAAAKRLIDAGADVNATMPAIGAPVHAAIVNQDGALVRLLIENKADVNLAAGSMDSRPLHFAAEYDLVDMAELLLDEGADIDGRNAELVTPLSQAALLGSLGVVELLVERGADIEARDMRGETALHNAAVRLHDVVVGYLLARGAAVNVRNNQELTPLSRVVIHQHSGDSATAEILRTHGGIM